MKAPEPQAILLDLDDTIINYGGGVEACWRAVCLEATRAVPSLNPGALFDAINRRRKWYWSDPERHREGRTDLRAASGRIVRHALAELGHDLPALATTIAHRYRDSRDERMHLFPDAVESLGRLRERGLRLGLVTNGTGPDQRAKIDRFALADYFDHILIEGEFGQGKPEPQVYVAALAALQTAPETTWFVGDNLEWDVAAPQRLGCYAVWLDGARRGLPTGTPVRPDRIIHALKELLCD